MTPVLIEMLVANFGHGLQVLEQLRHAAEPHYVDALGCLSSGHPDCKAIVSIVFGEKDGTTMLTVTQ